MSTYIGEIEARNTSHKPRAENRMVTVTTFCGPAEVEPRKMVELSIGYGDYAQMTQEQTRKLISLLEEAIGE